MTKKLTLLAAALLLATPVAAGTSFGRGGGIEIGDGGTLSTAGAVDFTDGVLIASEGIVNSATIQNADVYVSAATIDQAMTIGTGSKLIFEGDTTLDSLITFPGSAVWEGNGNVLTLGTNAATVVSSGTLTIQNITIDTETNSGSFNGFFADANSYALHNVTINGVHFDNVSISAHTTANTLAAASFTFGVADTSRPSIITLNEELILTGTWTLADSMIVNGNGNLVTTNAGASFHAADFATVILKDMRIDQNNPDTLSLGVDSAISMFNVTIDNVYFDNIKSTADAIGDSSFATTAYTFTYATATSPSVIKLESDLAFLGIGAWTFLHDANRAITLDLNGHKLNLNAASKIVMPSGVATLVVKNGVFGIANDSAVTYSETVGNSSIDFYNTDIVASVDYSFDSADWNIKSDCVIHFGNTSIGGTNNGAIVTLPGVSYTGQALYSDTAGLNEVFAGSAVIYADNAQTNDVFAANGTAGATAYTGQTLYDAGGLEILGAGSNSTLYDVNGRAVFVFGDSSIGFSSRIVLHDSASLYYNDFGVSGTAGHLYDGTAEITDIAGTDVANDGNRQGLVYYDGAADYGRYIAVGSTQDLSGYVTSSSLTTTLSDYTTTAGLSSLATSDFPADLITSGELATSLGEYTTTAGLSSLATSDFPADLITSSELTTSLGNYTTTAELSASYASQASVDAIEAYSTSGNIQVSDFDGGGYTLASDISLKASRQFEVVQSADAAEDYTIIGSDYALHCDNGTGALFSVSNIETTANNVTLTLSGAVVNNIDLVNHVSTTDAITGGGTASFIYGNDTVLNIGTDVVDTDSLSLNFAASSFIEMDLQGHTLDTVTFNVNDGTSLLIKNGVVRNPVFVGAHDAAANISFLDVDLVVSGTTTFGAANLTSGVVAADEASNAISFVFGGHTIVRGGGTLVIAPDNNQATNGVNASVSVAANGVLTFDRTSLTIATTDDATNLEAFALDATATIELIGSTVNVPVTATIDQGTMVIDHTSTVNFVNNVTLTLGGVDKALNLVVMPGALLKTSGTGTLDIDQSIS